MNSFINSVLLTVIFSSKFSTFKTFLVASLQVLCRLPPVLTLTTPSSTIVRSPPLTGALTGLHYKYPNHLKQFSNFTPRATSNLLQIHTVIIPSLLNILPLTHLSILIFVILICETCFLQQQPSLLSKYLG